LVANLDDHVEFGILVEKVLQGIVLASACSLSLVDDLVEVDIQHGAEDHAQDVGRGKDTEPGKDDACRAVAALKLLKDGEHLSGQLNVVGHFCCAHNTGEKLKQEVVDGVKSIGHAPFGPGSVKMRPYVVWFQKRLTPSLTETRLPVCRMRYAHHYATMAAWFATFPDESWRRESC